MRRSLFALAALLLLTACDESAAPEPLQATAPITDPYQSALASGYKRFAEAEYAQADWNTSEYLTAKATAAAQGKSIQPENPATWDISVADHPEFATARTALLNAIAANKSTQPAQTADAMLAYDRWVIGTHNQTDAARSEEHRTAFAASLARLQDVHTVEPGIAAPSSEPLAPSIAIGHGPTIFYFPFDSDTLGSSANSAVGALASEINAVPKASVSINGHTDRAGTEQYNLALSERRAKFVLHALEAAGIPAKRLHYFAFGESDPAVPTEDGVREPRNRRVEVVIDK